MELSFIVHFCDPLSIALDITPALYIYTDTMPHNNITKELSVNSVMAFYDTIKQYIMLQVLFKVLST